ncbi:hypothetical protein BKA69DRAFT_8881 [Paraphysoderma sedebokerense]|nr:hypothetical protein BKA69DRAFT_8881 [Paraphysoderma sedebokerense]
MSPWSYTQTLIDSFCAKISPSRLYRKLKLALLLSLSSLSVMNSIIPPLHILLVSNTHEPVLNRIMDAAAAIRGYGTWDHGFQKTPQEIAELVKVVEDFAWIPSSPLTRSKNGVLRIPLNGKKKNQIVSLEKVLRASSIPITPPTASFTKRNSANYSSSLTFQNNVSIWSHLVTSSHGSEKIMPKQFKKKHSSGLAASIPEHLHDLLR